MEKKLQKILNVKGFPAAKNFKNLSLVLDKKNHKKPP